MSVGPARIARWRRTRSLRARLVIISVLPLTVAVIVGIVGVVTFFSAGRIRDLDRQTRAEADVLVALLRTGQLTTPLPQPAGSPLLAQVLSPSGTVVAATASASRTLPLVTLPVTGSDSTSTDNDNSYGNVPLRIRVTAVTVDGATDHVVVAAPLGDIRRALQALRQTLLLLVPVLVAAAAALAWIVIGYTLRPVERLRSAAEALADRPGRLPVMSAASSAPPGPRDYLPEPSGDDEISRLTRTFNQILLRLHHALAQQQDFVADAAHELRSPLSALRVQLDIYQAHPNLQATTDFVSALSHDVDRLIRLANDLLLLARLDSGAGVVHRVPVDLTEIAAAEGPAAVIDGDRDALVRLVANLVDNARRYARTTVATSVTEDDGDAVLTVDDDGPGIPPDDRDRVFDRWARLDPGRERHTGGAGLGLALARQISTAHGGVITIRDSPLGGTRVEVRLPLSALK